MTLKIFTAIELACIKELAYIMRLLETMTKKVSAAQYFTVSKVVPMIRCAIDKLKDMKPTSSISRDLKDTILQKLEKRFGQFEYSLLLAIVTMCIYDSRIYNFFQDKSDDC